MTGNQRPNAGDRDYSQLRGDLDRRLCVAPMMDWTDRHCRYLLRLIAPHALLYTEMIVAAAIEHGDTARLLEFHEHEHPLALQVGGSDPRQLAVAARAGLRAGYDEINLNVGCPSGRVQAGKFGVCLMREPQLVADCVRAMRDAVDLPITVKTRIGVDDDDSFEFLLDFATAVTAGGCDALVVHARKAWLQGLSPKENRDVPPLDYGIVLRLRQNLGEIPIVVNGGIGDIGIFTERLREFDGVMVGRAAYQTPMVLAEMERVVYPGSGLVNREQVVEAYLPYVASQLARGVRLHNMTRHMLGLFQGYPGARHWRRHLSQASSCPDAGIEFVESALAHVTSAA